VSRREEWDRYFMSLARRVASRSTCLRRRVGAVLVLGNRVLATGYNGAPSGLPHCEELGCLRDMLGVPSGERQELCRALHAEQNALIQAAIHGVSVKGATIYCTHRPCITCAKMLINAGVRRVVYEGGYPDELAEGLLREAGVRVERLPSGIEFPQGEG